MKCYLYLLVIVITFGAMRTFADNEFGGQSLDASQTYYLGARNYDPETGAYLAKDPIGITGGVNSYQYVSDNPVNMTDPLGLFGTWAYVAQGASYTGGAVLAISGAAMTGVGAGTSEFFGIGVPVAVLGVSFMVQGSSTMTASGLNISYMELHPDQTEIPLNSSGAGGLMVSALARANGVENSASFSTVNADGSFNGWGVANGAASIFDVVTTAGISGTSTFADAITSAQINSQFPGLAGTGLAAITPFSSDPNSAMYLNTSLIGFGGLSVTAGNTSSAISSIDAVFGDQLNSSGNSSSGDTVSSSGDIILPVNPGVPPVGGVLLNTAATLVGENLSDLTGAMYDPASGQFMFLGTNNPTPVKNINLDYSPPPCKPSMATLFRLLSPLCLQRKYSRLILKIFPFGLVTTP